MITKYKYFIFSEDPDKLLEFYTKVLAFEIIKELKLPKDYGYSLKVNDGYELWIAHHSKVEGYNKDPYRHIITMYTNNIDTMYRKIRKAKGVKIVQELIHMSEFNPKEKRRVFTFFDPEGNCIQFIGD